MCLLIYKPANQTVPEDAFKRGFSSNRDGGGFAYARDGKLIIRKPFWDVESMWAEAKEFFEYPMIIHFRITTHGGTCKANTHPFNAGGGWAMGHNGMISKAIPQQDSSGIMESDTRAYIREFIAPIMEYDPTFLKADGVADMMSKHIGGSKLVFLNGKGEHVIVNEGSGEWDKGVWYSNCSFRAPRNAGNSQQTNTQHGGYSPTNWTRTYNHGTSTPLIREIAPYWKKPDAPVIAESRRKPVKETTTQQESRTFGTIFRTEAVQFEKQTFTCSHCRTYVKDEAMIRSILDTKEVFCMECWLGFIQVPIN